MNKELIHTRFAKTLSSYNENAKIQKQMAQKLITLLGRKTYKSILEIGCGTGFLTELANNLEFDTYKAIDIVEECQSYIYRVNPEIKFIKADIESYVEQDLDKYDLIISNASLQWLENFEVTMKKLYSKLNNDGELIFSTFGAENFKEIFQVTGKTLNYYSASEIQNLFQKCEIYPEIHTMTFDSPKDILRHLQRTGVNAIESRVWTKRDLSEFENRYKKLYPQKLVLTYNPIYIKAINRTVG